MKNSSPMKPLSILVIEDNPGDYLLLKEKIESAGIPAVFVELVESLTAAREYLRHNKPHIIFLDLYLPDSSGLDSFTELKPYASNSAVIILSGLSDTHLALEAIAQGAQDYLAKGEFDEKLLGKTMTYAIERRRNLETLRQANERYSLASKATHDLIWDWDLNTDEIYRDEQGVKQVYGISSNKQICHFDQWNKWVHPDDTGRVIEMIKDIKESKDKDFFEVEYQFSTEAGEYKYIYDRGYVVRNAEGIPTRIIGAARDITERRKLEEALQEARIRQQKAVTEATIKGQENERKQLGIELHDNINQILATSQLYLDFALSSPEVKPDLVLKGKDFVIIAAQEIRKLSHALLPPSFEEFGLIQALSDLVDNITVAAKFRICKNWSDFSEQVLKKDQKLTIYRIVQEQLNNIIKHAAASHVVVSISSVNEGKNVQLLLKDDGQGFDMNTKKNGVGLRNITGRAELFDGKVVIQSEPGNGCELTVTFPCAVC